MQYMRLSFSWLIVITMMVTSVPVAVQSTMAQADPEALGQTVADKEDALPPLDAPARNYLFVHDTSKNMRRKKRIAMMQDTIRTVLSDLPQTSRAGLQAFGHRFSLDGPDFCSDSEIILPFDPINMNKEDFDTQLNLLSKPKLGGGAPVGMALRQGFDAVKDFEEPKEIFFNMVDLQECPNEQTLSAIYSACTIDDLHLTLIGIGLKRDYQTLQDAKVEQLGCVDLINVTTPEDGENLPARLLTRFSLQFRNAEGELLDPQPGDKLHFRLSRQYDDGEIELVKEKYKDSGMRGSSLETVGLEEGKYLLDLEYQGQQLRFQKAVAVSEKHETREILQLGRMLVEVTDFSGKPLESSLIDDLQITLFDAGSPIRSVREQDEAEFDLLPGNQYTIMVRYTLGGAPQTVESTGMVTIREGNHKHVAIPLPLGSISGRIIDMHGQPDSGVTVFLKTEDGQLPGKSMLTGSDGRYSFHDLADGVYQLCLKKAGYKDDLHSIVVVGGRKKQIDDFALFRGIEIQVNSVSGKIVDDADVRLIDKQSGERIAVIQQANIYRNAQEIQPGEYAIEVSREGYQTAFQEISYTDTPPFADVPFDLAYYVTLSGTVTNARQDAVPGAQLEFESQHSSPVLQDGQKAMLTSADGRFHAKLLVSDNAMEHMRVVWYDNYNQRYSKDIEFSLPEDPQDLDLGRIALPINFLQLSLSNILGEPINATLLLLTHQQSGQTGIHVHRKDQGQYESAALLDGDYNLRVMKRGYQNVEHQFSIRGGEIQHAALVLRNYVTIRGTIVDGQQNRVATALISLDEKNCELTAPQPIVTGKDGRFQTTVLVRNPGSVGIDISWKSPESGKQYRMSRDFELSASPAGELSPYDLGSYELPANFIRVEVHDVFGHGLPGVEVQFISRHGDKTPAIELGNGVYESLDLYDGYYNIALTKDGYKENILLSDVSVGENSRDIDAGPIRLAHYATITGTVLNGRSEGMPNIEIFFAGQSSEQLESCRTGRHGKFSTTLLVTGPGKEHWKAVWDEDDVFSKSGVLTLPARPHDVLNIGEVRLPVNFVSIPLQDVRGKILSETALTVSAQNVSEDDMQPVFTTEELEPGLYQIQNLPDGDYRVTFKKPGYESGRFIDFRVKGGEHLRQPPVQLGYYVDVSGHTINGKGEAVPKAMIHFKALHSQLEEPAEDAPDEQESVAREVALPQDSILTDQQGRFSARLLVTSPGIEELDGNWDGQFESAFQLDLSDGPGRQETTLKLPINFITVMLKDIRGEPLRAARVTLESQNHKHVHQLEEIEAGTYQSAGLPDGSYYVQVSKEQYQPRSTLLSLQEGESRTVEFRLNHYVIVKGQILDGKQEGISAAVVSFANLKTETNEKIFSGTDGVFETRVLVRELGRESGEISWDGKNGSYQLPFLVELPPGPGEIVLPKEQTVLPINYVTVEVKSVAATGIAGATVYLVKQADQQTIEARDNKNGNYTGEEIPDGVYDITVKKEKYQSVTIKDVRLEGGVYKNDLSVPSFSHYISLSGLVVNGKRQGVADAIVSIPDPKGVQNVEDFITRDDGSFTLHALVTDVSTETLEVVWNETYRTSVQLKPPLLPEDLQLKEIRLPINFASVKIQDIYGAALSGVNVTFARKHTDMPGDPALEISDLSGLETSASLFFSGNEIAEGVYESPELPDNDYLIIATKQGYVQDHYPQISVRSGMNVSSKPLLLPHLITIKGRVIDGKGDGVQGASIVIAENSSQRSRSHLESDAAGYFSERLLITGRGPEFIRILKGSSAEQQEKRFVTEQEFTPLKKPGEQEFGTSRLPVNFIPIRVSDVNGKAIEDAIITIYESGAGRFDARARFPVVYRGDGKYEAGYLADGDYTISAAKDGYETQESSLSVSAGEVAAEVPFILPHYVTVKGIVTMGKGDGVPDAVLEFAQENSRLLPVRASQEDRHSPSSIITDIDGQFTAKLLIIQSGAQQVDARWNDVYAKQFSFPLPESPDPDYRLPEEIRLPVNFVPFRVTNILQQGLTDVDITLRPMENLDSSPLLASPLGEGHYEARELMDGTYMMTVQKDGYQEVTGNFSVKDGVQSPEQHFALPHYVSIAGKVVNGKGQGVPGAELRLKGLNSSSLAPENVVESRQDGSFLLDVLVTGSSSGTLEEHLEILWNDGSSNEGLNFSVSHSFLLPTSPRRIDLGALSLPANFFPVQVEDVSGKNLSAATVTFIDQDNREFPAKELSDGYYEGQNLPDGLYSVRVVKEGYQSDQSDAIHIDSSSANTDTEPVTDLSFQLPYYVEIRGTSVNGKGQILDSGVSLSLAGRNSRLLEESVRFDQDGTFRAKLLVTRMGKEQLRLSWEGSHGVHSRDLSFELPEAPQLLDVQRQSLPVNFIPVEVKDLQGHGLSDASVQLYHVESERMMKATDMGHGQYEGQDLPDGSYEISATKEGYKASRHVMVTVKGGVVSEKRGFLLSHYVDIVGIATNGNGEGVSDPVIMVEELRSEVVQANSEVSGEFALRLEVQEVGNEQIVLDWKHEYRLPFLFKLPEQPGIKNLGEIRLPINFVSIFADDISGSTLSDAAVVVEDAQSGFRQSFKTDVNGFCRTDELPNGEYLISVSKKGYQTASQKIQLYDGRNVTLRFALPHYVLVQGHVIDIMKNPVGNADIVFEEFFDENYQKIRTVSDPESGQFSQQLLIDDPAFLERQKGHFSIIQGDLRQDVLFKIPPHPDQVFSYKTLLFPVTYLNGKVVDTDIPTIPIADARVVVTAINGPFAGTPRNSRNTKENAAFSELITDSLGEFCLSHLALGEYKISIHKDGYAVYEDFIRISSLLQEQEFALRKAE